MDQHAHLVLTGFMPSFMWHLNILIQRQRVERKKIERAHRVHVYVKLKFTVLTHRTGRSMALNTCRRNYTIEKGVHTPPHRSTFHSVMLACSIHGICPIISPSEIFVRVIRPCFSDLSIQTKMLGFLFFMRTYASKCIELYRVYPLGKSSKEGPNKWPVKTRKSLN